MGDFPFFKIAVAALFAHMLTAIFAVGLEAIFNSGGWMREWGKGAQTIRIFTVQRDEVRFLVSWVAITVARVAICIGAVSLVLAVLT